MNAISAKDILLHPQSADSSDIQGAIECAVKALEKQTPKKPDTKITNRGIDVSGEYDIDSDYICPICKCVVGECEIEEHWFEYCPNCGQALDWSDSE